MTRKKEIKIIALSLLALAFFVPLVSASVTVPAEGRRLMYENSTYIILGQGTYDSVLRVNNIWYVNGEIYTSDMLYGDVGADLSGTQWFVGGVIFVLITLNIVLLAANFALMRFVFAVVSLALCALAFAYAVPFSPYLQLLGCLVSVLSMYFASRARE